MPVAVLHSSLTDKERANGWIDARDGNAGIILGTRSAIFMPMKFPGAIIVDEEHDASYKQHDGFRYSARDLAVLRGQLEKIPVILVGGIDGTFKGNRHLVFPDSTERAANMLLSIFLLVFDAPYPLHL